VFVEQRKTARVLLVLSFIWILNCCAYQHPPLQPAPEVPPAPVEIKPETPVAVPDTPALEIPTPAESEPRFYIHKVRWPKETLSHIAKWYTGTVKNWKAIAKANPELDPKKIDTGDTISIPEDLLTSRKPMPLSFMRASVRKKGIPSSSSNKTSIKSESPKLFRPIESEPSIIETDAAKLFGPIESQPSSIEPDAAKLFGPIE
jgi:hypothetical protein